MSATQYPSGGAAVWGEITGNILDQTDTLPSQVGLSENSAPILVPQAADTLSYSHLADPAVAATASGTALGVGTFEVTATAAGTATGTGTVAATATASGTASDAGTTSSTITVGSKVYTVVASSPGFDEIAQGADATEYADNIASRVNADTDDTLCTVIATTGSLAFTANDNGVAGNSITLSTTDPNLTLGSFSGGVDAGTISVGSKVYTVVASGATGDEIDVGATAADFADNIATKVTADTADTDCTCVATVADLAFTANTGGIAGNSIPISTTDPDLTLDPAFTGGVDAGTITVGNKVYTVVASGATGDEINAGASATDYAANIATQVNTDTADTLCTAIDSTGDLDFTANTAGVDGNSIALSTTDPNLTLVPFAGGSDDVYNVSSASIATLTGVGISGSNVGAVYGTNLVSGATITTTSAGTLTLLAADNQIQQFVGSTTHTLVLPVVTTLAEIGWSYTIINDSTDFVTINSSGANLVQTVAPGASCVVVCIALTGTDATPWRIFYDSPGVVPAVSFTADYTTVQGDVGKAFDAPLADTGGFTLTIDDNLTYDVGACWTGTNLSDGDMDVTLDDTPTNLIWLQGAGVTDTGTRTVASGGSFVVRLSADGVTYVITGTGIS